MKHPLFNADIIVPFRGASADRRENLYTLIRYFHANYVDYTMRVVEADSESCLDWSLIEGEIQHHFIENSGSFPVSLARNYGVKMGQSDRVVIYDVDSVVSPPVLSMCVDAVRTHAHHHDVLNPFSLVFNLNGALKDQFMIDSDYTKLEEASKTETPDLSILYHQAAGGVVVFRREDYIKFGGYNTIFNGWGGEDNEMFSRTAKLGLRWHKMAEPLFHLHHDNENRDALRVDAEKNTKLADDIKEYSVEELQSICDELRSFFE